MADLETLLADTRYWAEVAAPSTPASGSAVTYTKTDGKLYLKNDAGTEYDLTIGGSAWTAFTPTWTTSGSAPSLGNGTVVGRWQLVGLKAYAIHIEFTAGSTTTFGTGTWSFALPAGLTAASTNRQILSCVIIDAGTANFLAQGKINASDTKVSEIRAGSTAAVVTNTHPHTWANTDVLTLSGVIEVQ